jgi:hypothetical protein
MVAAAISSNGRINLYKRPTTNFTTRVDCGECLRNEVQGFGV